MTSTEVEIKAAMLVGLTPQAFRALPLAERIEMQEYLRLQALKAEDVKQRQKELAILEAQRREQAAHALATAPKLKQ